jgi:integrase
MKTMIPAVRICPPMPAHSMLDAEPQFRRTAEIKTTFDEHGNAHATGVTFPEFQRMQINEHRLVKFFRTGVPSYMFSPSTFREVIVRSVERRTGFRTPFKGTLAERLASAEKILRARREQSIASLDRLCGRYIAVKNNEAPDETLTAAELEAMIENVDTLIRFDEHPAAYTAAILYWSYCSRMKSNDVGSLIGMKPAHIRQLLLRCNKIAQSIESGDWKTNKSGRKADSQRATASPTA